MNKEQLLNAFLEDDLLREKGYLKENESAEAKWSDYPDKKMLSIMRVAIEGVLREDSQGVITRKINQFLEP